MEEAEGDDVAAADDDGADGDGCYTLNTPKTHYFLTEIHWDRNWNVCCH